MHFYVFAAIPNRHASALGFCLSLCVCVSLGRDRGMNARLTTLRLCPTMSDACRTERYTFYLHIGKVPARYQVPYQALLSRHQTEISSRSMPFNGFLYSLELIVVPPIETNSRSQLDRNSYLTREFHKVRPRLVTE